MKKGIIIGGMLLLGVGVLWLLYVIIMKMFLSRRGRIMRAARRLGLNPQQAKMVAAISEHETANYTSELAKQHNNYFGMHMPAGSSEQMNRRKTTATGKTGDNWAVFMGLESSVKDFMNCWGYHGKAFPLTLDAVITFMKAKGYFTDTYENYYNGVKHYYLK